MSCNNQIDARGARADILATYDTVFDKTFTFTDSEGAALDLSEYTDWIIRVQTDPETEYTETAGDISVASNVVSCDFLISVAVGTYDYQLLAVNATGEKEFLRGKFKIS